MPAVALFNDTSTTRHYGCRLVIDNLARGLQDQDIHITHRVPVGVDWREAADLLPGRGEVDAVIVNGEGSLHHSRERPRANWLADVGRYAKADLSVPSFLINCTLFENAPETYSRLAHFDAIYVRDTDSLKALENHDLSGMVVPDLTLARGIEVAKEWSPIGCGTDSVLRDASDALKKLCAKRGWPWRPMAPPNPPKLIDVLKRPTTVKCLQQGAQHSIDPDDYIAFLSSHGVVATGRYHAVMLCLLTRTPFLAVESNTPKISSLLKDAFRHTRRNTESVASLESMLNKPTGFSSEELSAIDAYCTGAERKIASMLTNIGDLII